MENAQKTEANLNSALMIGTSNIALALIFYSIGILVEQRKRFASNLVLTTLMLGVIFDITATVFMISGSSHSPFTVHGFLGFSALGAMTLVTVLLWRSRVRIGSVVHVSQGLHIYSRIAYIWWVAIFFVGGLRILFR